MDNWNKKHLKDPCIPEWMRTWSIFPQKHHDSASMAWSHEVLMVPDVIRCIVYTKGLRLNDAVKVVDEMKMAMLDHTKPVFIPIIFTLIQPQE